MFEEVRKALGESWFRAFVVVLGCLWVFHTFFGSIAEVGQAINVTYQGKNAERREAGTADNAAAQGKNADRREAAIAESAVAEAEIKKATAMEALRRQKAEADAAVAEAKIREATAQETLRRQKAEADEAQARACSAKFRAIMESQAPLKVFVPDECNEVASNTKRVETSYIPQKWQFAELPFSGRKNTFEEDNNDEDIRNCIGSSFSHITKSKFTETITLCSKVANDRKYSDHWRAVALRNIGNALSDAGDDRKGIDAITTSIEMSDDDDAAFSFRAAIYEKLGMTQKAIEDYNQALSKGANQFDRMSIYQHLAGIYLDRKEYDVAISNLTKTIEATPDSLPIKSDLYKLRGDWWLKFKSDNVRAQEDYARAKAGAKPQAPKADLAAPRTAEAARPEPRSEPSADRGAFLERLFPFLVPEREAKPSLTAATRPIATPTPAVATVSPVSEEDPDVVAVRQYQLAADRGDAEAQFNLANMYYSGKGGLQPDPQETARLYRLSADQGYAQAQLSLAFLYEKGDGVFKDLREAAKYYHLAADQGSPAAQANLADAYEKSAGVPKNLCEAKRFRELAAAQGNSYAQKMLKEMRVPSRCKNTIAAR